MLCLRHCLGSNSGVLRRVTKLGLGLIKEREEFHRESRAGFWKYSSLAEHAH